MDDSPEGLRASIRAAYLADEAEAVNRLVAETALAAADRQAISAAAVRLVRAIRSSAAPSLMENFLGEYGLSTREGVALMCLAEALLRVPDAETIDELISDKITPADWGRHLGHSSSSLVNASTWALMLTGRVLSHEEENLTGVLHGVVRRLGEPVVRTAVGQAMREMGRQFVLGRTIEEALERARGMMAKGYSYSFDMLGEAARTEADARRYHLSYSDAITALARQCGDDIRANHGISVKLSALHARYEFIQRERVMSEVVARVRSLALLAKSANMGFNIDAEEADRLDISLDVIEATLADPALAGWDGFGVVVQAFGQRGAPVLDWLYALAGRLDRRIMVRLVKGAYWDTEIKRAQVLGLTGFPVFTRKANTDVSFLACARKLLGMTDRIYPQFATHNAHSVAAILHLAGDKSRFEFQRLHGMGESLHQEVLEEQGTRCRIYAPVGAHRDLLAYLVRRLLENGANSSFVNQIVDTQVTPEEIARDPFTMVEELGGALANPSIKRPCDLYGPERRNSRGWDFTDPLQTVQIEEARGPYRRHRWHAAPLLAAPGAGANEPRSVVNPADPEDVVGTVTDATQAQVNAAFEAAAEGFAEWSARPVEARSACLEEAADLYEAHAGELFALATREAGKTLPDGIAEVREAVDFLRYYANEAKRYETQEPGSPLGTFVCISPWNFPLAIFTGQIAAALAAGNAVIAKPAEQSPLIGARAVELMHMAGIPRAAIQLLPGDGPTVGGALTSHPEVAGVCFTGSTDVARIIQRSLSEHASPRTPLIAETGGLNAMIVDSTALPEQAVRDILISSFQSAGQRCSALRILYVQRDVEDRLLEMLFGAMDELRQGDPWMLSTDVGPVIDTRARQEIEAYCEEMDRDGRLLKKLPPRERGNFVAPAVYRVAGIEEMPREIFGPILHVANFEAERLDEVIDAINARRYGLTFGLHTRVDSRVQRIVDRIRAGNLYVNRNQIGAIVGSQPFGGEGLSGTGPKAGGPNYLRSFRRAEHHAGNGARAGAGSPCDSAALGAALSGLDGSQWGRREDRGERLRAALRGAGVLEGVVATALNFAARVPAGVLDLPGPTGESNRLRCHPRGRVLCLGPGAETALAQAVQALHQGCPVLVVCAGAPEAVRPLTDAGMPVAAIDATLDAAALETLEGIAAVACAAETEALARARCALAARDGELVPLVWDLASVHRYVHERHLCVDTTAAGGNASLLAGAEG